MSNSTNETSSLCCLRMSHTDSTEDTEEPNSALLLEDLGTRMFQIANETSGLCCFRMSHTDSTEDTDREPNSALLLEIREHESFKSRELKYIRWICEICVLFLLFNVDVVVRM